MKSAREHIEEVAADAMSADGAFGADVTANALFIDATPGGAEFEGQSVAEICAQLDKRVGFADIETLKALIEVGSTNKKDIRALLALVRKVLKSAPAEAQLEGAEREAHLLRALADHVAWRERENERYITARSAMEGIPRDAFTEADIGGIGLDATEKAELIEALAAAAEQREQQGTLRERYDALDAAGKAELIANLRGTRVIPDEEWKQLIADDLDYRRRIFVYLTNAAKALEAQLRRSH
jgi:hypothetical protein